VVHAAMMLDDCLLLKLDRERLEQVLGPKIQGAWHLHQQTRNLGLDFFVCYSSMSAVFGAAGQGNYSAANAFLDALPHYRQGNGLVGLTVNWGYLGEVGYVARNDRISERFEGRGVLSFTPRQALTLLGQLMRSGASQAGVMRIDWARFRPPGAASALSTRFRDLGVGIAVEKDGAAKERVSVRETVLSAEPARRKELLLGLLRDRIARILAIASSKLDLEKPLTNLGLDSLMAVELRNSIEGELRVHLPIMALMQGLSVVRLCDLLLEQLTQGEAVAASSPGAVLGTGPGSGADSPAAPVSNGMSSPVNQEKAQEILADLDTLSNVEVDSLLDSMLSEEEPASRH